MERRINLTDIIVTLVCLLGAYWIHINTFINWDVAWHVEGARRLYAGGNYLKNVFDNNSLYVFAYYFPVIWLRYFISGFYPNLVVIYVLLTNVVSLILCYNIIHNVFKPKEKFARKLLYYTIIYMLLFLPAFNFGHREIVLINFFLPYFLILIFTATYEGQIQFSKWLLFTTSLLAAFGIAQNIFYITIPLFLDIYLLIKMKKMSIYQILLYCYLFIFALLVALIYPEYVKHIIPMVLCYESGFNFPFLVLLLEILTFSSLLTIFLVLINIKKLHKSDDIIMSFIAIVCSLLIYFFELKLWYYHLYPAICFTILLLGLLIIKYYEETLLGLHIRPRVNTFSAALASGILVTIFAVIIGFTKNEMAIFKDPNYEANKWIQFAKNNFKDRKVFFFVIKLGPAYSLPFYANANVNIVSPWSNPWLLPYIILQKKNNSLFCNLETDIQLFRKLASDAIAINKPDYLVIEETPRSLFYQNKRFNYIDFFSQDKNFATLFAKYIPYTHFDSFTIYKLNTTTSLAN